MRSRYSAFVLQNVEYLLASQAEQERPVDQRSRLESTIKTFSWLALHIVACQSEPFDPDGAWVEFVAFYQQGGNIHQLHEKSVFVLRGQQWYYLEGDILAGRIWRRNEPCWCRSGKKTKKCHGQSFA